MKKRLKIVAVVVCLLMTISVLAACKTSSNALKKRLSEFLEAKSFTILIDNEVAVNMTEEAFYWREYYSDYGKYDECYFIPDSTGKKWMYFKNWGESWKKSELTDIEYWSDYTSLRKHLEVGDCDISLVKTIYSGFDDLMIKQQPGVFRPKTEVLAYEGLETLELRIEKNNLCCNIKRKSGVSLVIEFRDINKTKLSLPSWIEETAILVD